MMRDGAVPYFVGYSVAMLSFGYDVGTISIDENLGKFLIMFPGWCLREGAWASASVTPSGLICVISFYSASSHWVVTSSQDSKSTTASPSTGGPT
jgi:hypothetical protein